MGILASPTHLDEQLLSEIGKGDRRVLVSGRRPAKKKNCTNGKKKRKKGQKKTSMKIKRRGRGEYSCGSARERKLKRKRCKLIKSGCAEKHDKRAFNNETACRELCRANTTNVYFGRPPLDRYCSYKDEVNSNFNDAPDWASCFCCPKANAVDCDEGCKPIDNDDENLRKKRTRRCPKTAMKRIRY